MEYVPKPTLAKSVATTSSSSSASSSFPLSSYRPVVSGTQYRPLPVPAARVRVITRWVCGLYPTVGCVRNMRPYARARALLLLLLLCGPNRPWAWRELSCTCLASARASAVYTEYVLYRQRYPTRQSLSMHVTGLRAVPGSGLSAEIPHAPEALNACHWVPSKSSGFP